VTLRIDLPKSTAIFLAKLVDLADTGVVSLLRAGIDRQQLEVLGECF